jgi:excinuclease UvrABC helicase subunit UvrB
VEILYERNDGDFRRGTFRVRGDVIELYPTYDDYAYRIELWGDEIDTLSQIDPLLGQVRQTYQRLPIYPKTHYVMSARQRTGDAQHRDGARVVDEGTREEAASSSKRSACSSARCSIWR